MLCVILVVLICHEQITQRVSVFAGMSENPVSPMLHREDRSRSRSHSKSRSRSRSPLADRRGKGPANNGQEEPEGAQPSTSTGVVNTQLHAQQLHATGKQVQAQKLDQAQEGAIVDTQATPVTQMPGLQSMPSQPMPGGQQTASVQQMPMLQPAPGVPIAVDQSGNQLWAGGVSPQMTQFVQQPPYTQQMGMPYMGYMPFQYPQGMWTTQVPQSEAPLPPSPAPTPPPLPPASVSARSESVDGSQAASSVVDLPGEAEDIVAKIIEDSSFEERIEMVGDILETELPTIKKKSGNFAMSVKKTANSVFKRLPASANFECKFDEFVQEISAAEGSRRAKAGKKTHSNEVGTLPSRVKPKMKFYEIGERPWNVHAVDAQKTLFNKAVYRGSTAPPVQVSNDRLMEWESMNRENVTVLSHVDHFIAAGQRLFECLFDKVDRGEDVSPEMLWNMSRQGICMLYSAGMGVQDLVRNDVWQIGEQVTTRRDAWLSKIKDKVPPANTDQLRFTSLNGPALFDEKCLENAMKAASVQKHDKVQDEMLSKVSNMTRSGSEKTSVGKGKFNKQSFQDFHGKGDSAGNSFSSKDKSQTQGFSSKPYQPKPQGGQSFNKGKGSQSNRGKKQGGFKKKNFSNY